MQARAIVTGGLGFIGSNLIKLLLKNNFFVINIDKMNYASNIYNLKNIKKKTNYKFYKLDICNKKILRMILKKHKPNVLFNLAAETHVDRSINNPQDFVRSNIMGVYNILECIKEYTKVQKNFKMVHVSTDEVYGDTKGIKKSKEEDKYQPSSPYSASKASADHLVKSFVRTYKLPAIISNCCNNYGPNQFPEKLIPKLIYNIIKNKPLLIYGRGKNSREWIHVQDHCEALLKIFLRGKIGESYNVGSNQNIQNIDITKKLITILKSNSIIIGNKVKIKFVKDRPGHDFRYALDCKKIHKELKWKSKINLNEGLADTFQWYLNNMDFFISVSKKLYDKRLGLNKK